MSINESKYTYEQGRSTRVSIRVSTIRLLDFSTVRLLDYSIAQLFHYSKEIPSGQVNNEVYVDIDYLKAVTFLSHLQNIP